MPKARSFLIVATLLVLGTGGIVLLASRGVDWADGRTRHAARRAGSAEGRVRELPPLPAPMPITIDGVNLRTERPPADGSARLIARTVTFKMWTDRFHDVRDAIDRLVRARHGTLVGVAGSVDGTGRRALAATFTVPVAEAEAARAGVRALGTLLQESSSTEDVTDGDRVLRSRIEMARAEDRRLTGLLAGGRSRLQDAAGVERARDRARVDADRLAIEESALTARTAKLTIVVTIAGA